MGSRESVRHNRKIVKLGYCIFAVSLGAAPEPVTLFYDQKVPQVAFAASEIRKAYTAAGQGLIESGIDRLASTASGIRIAIAADNTQSRQVAASLGVPPSKSSAPQSYAIRRMNTTVVVLGADPAGAMYGGLDIDEAIRLGSLDSLADSGHFPHIERRGIKFNVPLDARTPSYSDNSARGDAVRAQPRH